MVSCHTANSKPVKQEVNGTVILPSLVFSDLSIYWSNWEEFDIFFDEDMTDVFWSFLSVPSNQIQSLITFEKSWRKDLKVEKCESNRGRSGESVRRELKRVGKSKSERKCESEKTRERARE
jgi:hypothetical protein